MNSIIEDIKSLEVLSKYYFEFGIMTKEGEQKVNVNILNTDNTINTIKMKIADIMFFTENGTITIPGYHILEKSLNYINIILNIELPKIVDTILIKNIYEGEIEYLLNLIAKKVENYIKKYMIDTIDKNNKLGKIIDEKDSNKYIYDLKDLSTYLKCKVIRK